MALQRILFGAHENQSVLFAGINHTGDSSAKLLRREDPFIRHPAIHIEFLRVRVAPQLVA